MSRLLLGAARRVELPRPRGVACIVAREVDVPAGVQPVEWRLLTNPEAAKHRAGSRTDRLVSRPLEIELFFHVLKNACRVEALQLSTMEHLERALPLFMVVARGHTCPELDAELLFEREEWEAAFILNKDRPPKKPPRLNEVGVSSPGSEAFLERKADGKPRVKTL
jgi:Transposase Tn5 dimerisation domain